MPLVIFKLGGNQGYPHNVDTLSLPLDGKKITINLPREAYNKKWTLRSVNATRLSTSSTFLRWIEIELPQLMPEDHVRYYLNVFEPDVGNVPPPGKRLRFYPNRRQQDQSTFGPRRKAISVSPNLNMGVHRLDRLQLDMILYATNIQGGGSDAGLTSFELILEYE